VARLTKRDEKVEDEFANTLTARSALLDFYGDRAVTFASLFVASVFGTVTTLAIILSIPRIDAYPYLHPVLIVLSNIVFLPFAFTGYYTFKKFALYADIAQGIQDRSLRQFTRLESVPLNARADGKEDVSLLDYIVKKLVEEKNWRWKKLIAKRGFGLPYWILILVLWLVVYIPAFLE
jgi:hypothetical protein